MKTRAEILADIRTALNDAEAVIVDEWDYGYKFSVKSRGRWYKYARRGADAVEHIMHFGLDRPDRDD